MSGRKERREGVTFEEGRGRLRIQRLTSFHLRWIAMITMLCDHGGRILFPDQWIFLCIGRISFPIYCFLLVEGFYHTKSRMKYGLRLLVLGIISELPYNLVLYGSLFFPERQNIFFTLLIGLLLMTVLERTVRGEVQWGCIGAAMGIAWRFRVSYSYWGILHIVFFYYFRDSLLKKAGATVALSLLNSNPIQYFASFAMIPISLYNGKPGCKKFQYGFYIFYPAHLLLLLIVSKL